MTYLLLAELNAKSSCTAEIERLLCGLAEASRTEAGNVRYDVHRQRENPEAFVVYELYRDENACKEHLALPLVKRALQQFESLLITPPRILFCDRLSN